MGVIHYFLILERLKVRTKEPPTRLFCLSFSVEDRMELVQSPDVRDLDCPLQFPGLVSSLRNSRTAANNSEHSGFSNCHAKSLCDRRVDAADLDIFTLVAEVLPPREGYLDPAGAAAAAAYAV